MARWQRRLQIRGDRVSHLPPPGGRHGAPVPVLFALSGRFRGPLLHHELGRVGVREEGVWLPRGARVRLPDPDELHGGLAYLPQRGQWGPSLHHELEWVGGGWGWLRVQRNCWLCRARSEENKSSECDQFLDKLLKFSSGSEKRAL